MTTSAGVRPPGLLRRRRSQLLAGILLLGITAATAVWVARRSSAPPTPPPVPPDQTEPDVAAFLEKSRARVLKEPRSAQTWGSLGQAFLANEMEEESRICFAEAERLDPSNPRWPYYQGGMLMERGDPDTALPYLRRAAERCAVAEPDNQVPRLVLVETLLALNRVEESEDQLQQVLARQPDDPRTHFDLALAASARQDWQTSKSHLLRCLRSPFARQKASVQLAAVSRRLGDQGAAEKYHQQAGRLPADSEWSDPFAIEYLRWAVKKKSCYRLVESLQGAGRLREAVAALQPLVEKYPDDYLPRLTVGKVLGQMGENVRAAAMLREALRLAPDKFQAHYCLSMVLLAEAKEVTRKGGDRDAAEELFREVVESAGQALAIKPDYGFAYMPLGLALRRLGQRSAALTALRKAVHCNPEAPELHYYLGELLAEEGQQGAAKEQFEQVVQMAPPDTPWLETARARLAALRISTLPIKTPDNPNK